MSYIEKKVDDLGRIVLPIKFRNILNIDTNSNVFVSLENDSICIKPIYKYCVICGNVIEKTTDFRLCNLCIEKIKKT